MRITDLLKKQGITLGASPKDKQGAIDILVKLHEKCGNLKDTAAYKKGILDREAMGTTAIGMEVAIPHAKSAAVKSPALTAITVPGGVDYDSPDGAPCKLIFMIAATTDGDVHLEVLARLMQMLMHEDFTKPSSSPKRRLHPRRQSRAIRFWLSPPVPPVSLTPIWRLRRLPRRARRWASPSRSRPTAPAAPRTC